jgi:hypothetical protein
MEASYDELAFPYAVKFILWSRAFASACNNAELYRGR